MHLVVPSHRASGKRGFKSSRVRRLIAGASVAVMAMVGVVVTEQAAHAAGPAPIHNWASGLCMQPVPGDGGSIYDNGIPIWQVPCNGSPEQNWKKILVQSTKKQQCNPLFIFLPGRCGFDPIFFEYYLVNQLTLSCMDVTDARTDDRVPIQQWQCNFGGSEKWYMPPEDSAVGTFERFMNSRTGKCLDVPGGTLDATPMWQYHCTSNNGAQAFDIPPS
jgi:hypothetical protein